MTHPLGVRPRLRRRPVTHTFVVRNVSDNPVQIVRIVHECSCTTASKGDLMIPPHGEERITFTFNSRGYGGKVDKTCALLYGEDKKNEFSNCISRVSWTASAGEDGTGDAQVHLLHNRCQSECPGEGHRPATVQATPNPMVDRGTDWIETKVIKTGDEKRTPATDQTVTNIGILARLRSNESRKRGRDRRSE